MAVKTVGVFCSEYNELAFLRNGTDRHEIREKTSIGVLYWTLIEEFWKFAFRPNGVILQQTAIFVLLWRFSMSQAYGSGVMLFRLIKAFHLLEEGPTVCPPWIDFLCDWPFRL